MTDRTENVTNRKQQKEEKKVARATWLSKCCRKTTSENTKGKEQVVKGGTEIIQLLLEKEKKRSNRIEKRTLLMLTITSGDTDKAIAMIEQGADLTETDRYGNTAMHVALSTGHFDVAQCILEHSGDCTAKNNEGITPLHIIAEGKQVKLGAKFIRRGASVNCADKKGRTPLMIACRRGHFPMVSMLLKYGSDPQALDCNGWTAKDYASIMGNIQIINLLEQYIKNEVNQSEKKEGDSSVITVTSDEDDYEDSEKEVRHSQMAIPIKIQVDDVKKRRRSSIKLMRKHITESGEKKHSLKTKQVHDEEGNLLPLPDLLANIQSSASCLDDIHTWVTRHKDIIEAKANQCKELEQRVNKLTEDRAELLHTNKRLRNTIVKLATELEDAPKKDEADALGNELTVLKDGLAELGKEHSRSEKERERLKNFLADSQQTQESARMALTLKREEAETANTSSSEKLSAMQNSIRKATEDLKKKEKKAEELINHLMIFLRGTYKIMHEKPGQFGKVIEVLSVLDKNMEDTRENYNNIKEKYMFLGKNFDELSIKLALMKKHLSKIQSQAHFLPFTKKLTEMGVLEKDDEDEQNKEQMERSPEEILYDPTGLVSAPVTGQTGCRSTVEGMRYSWLEPPVKDSHKGSLSGFKIGGTESPKDRYNASTVSSVTSEESISDMEAKTATDEAFLADLKDKLADVIAKYKI